MAHGDGRVEAAGGTLNRGRLAYIMSRFPHLPETFILREMVELQRTGWDVAVYPLVVQQQAVVHAEAAGMMARTRRVALFSLEAVGAVVRAAVLQPGVFWKTWAEMVAGTLASPGFLARGLALFPQAAAMARRMQREGVQHIHAHYATHPALTAWIIHRLTGIPYSVTVHAHDIFKSQTMLAVKLREASFVVAISDFNREFLAQRVGEWLRPKVKVIHCGILPENYPARAHRSRSDRFEVLNIGSLQPYKGQIYLVEACALLRDWGIPVHCQVIGMGEEQARLEKRIAALNLGEHFKLLGPKTQAEVAALLQTADCYVQPSIIEPSGKMEGIPVALMEALACELPVVATRISGVPELVRPGETGLLAPPADIAALARALAAIYQDAESADAFGCAGRRLVLEQFDLRKNVDQLASLFSNSMLDTAI